MLTLYIGTEPFLRNLIDCSQYDFSFLTSTLQPLRMAPALRDTSAAALMPPSKFKVRVSPTSCQLQIHCTEQACLGFVICASDSRWTHCNCLAT